MIYDHHWKSSITYHKHNYSYRCRFIETSSFTPKPEVCEIDGKFQFQNWLNNLSRIWPNRSLSKMAHKMIFIWCLHFRPFFGKRSFSEIHKNSDSREISTFWVLISLVGHILHIRSETWPIITFEYFLLLKIVFYYYYYYCFSPQNYALHYIYFNILLTRSPWACKRFLMNLFCFNCD